MKILFVYPDINVRGGALSYHYGLGSLSSMLKKSGHQTALQYLYGNYDPKPLIQKIEEFKPDLIGITTVSFQYKYIKRLLKDISNYGIFTICGGPHISLAPYELEKTDHLNAICVGEGEYALFELVNALEKNEDITNIKNIWVKKDGKIYSNPGRPFIENLDELPFVDRELFDFQEIIYSDYDRAEFMASRGCPYSCTYCSNSGLRKVADGKYVRFRSIENVIAEIKDVVTRYKVKSIYLNDDVFTINKEYVENFCKLYKKEIGYPFEINTRVENLTLDMLEILKDAGCYRVAMGLEQGDEKFRREVLNRPMSNKKILEAFSLAKQVGLKTKTFNIVGFPFETVENHMETVRMNREIQPSSIVIYIFEPYPGTPLYDVCIENNFIEKEREEEEFVSRTDTFLKLPMFPRKEILKCYRRFPWRVYRGKSLKRALLFKIYYSKYGELLIRLMSPFKKKIQRFAIN
ncbi:MAG: B12-binding domain-containing radical SAM protein [Actinobacteria bacterium]|nr:B12-binding domain-containing radical SAM protein [Cyanobacteriota bacterium]MCL5771788.1 B12-binding domain-containing radical SAM protein [Actinomycetota bacterium]